MSKNIIKNYKKWEIVIEAMDRETRELLHSINQWFYKTLTCDSWIDMKKGKFHVISWIWHRVTEKGYRYLEKIIKKQRLTYWIKKLIETEKWNELDIMFNSNDKVNDLSEEKLNDIL